MKPHDYAKIHALQKFGDKNPLKLCNDLKILQNFTRLPLKIAMIASLAL
jgi:hypothetical protein